ncbi:MAG TPA: molybdopterin converting factor subunit 1 [Chitinophagaceae bacterium]|jgi:molybdopterin converting factor subunit 1|nr:molybdopterin converting factor subunit 1 [Chitinophagaceae bacterium]
MTVTILAFGAVKEIVGGTSVKIEIPHAVTVEELKALLKERYKELNQLSSLMIAVNNEYAFASDLVSEDDEIALIPPVSGG